MAKPKNNYPEIDDIRHDLDSLKNNVVELTKHLKENGSEQTEEIKKAIQTRWSKLQKQGQLQVKNVERKVKEKPAQSLAIAFAAGLVLSALARRR